GWRTAFRSSRRARTKSRLPPFRRVSCSRTSGSWLLVAGCWLLIPDIGLSVLGSSSCQQPVTSTQHRERSEPMADEIDYQLIGDDLQAVIITLDPGEMVIAEAGAMMYMQDGIVMSTTLDPNAQGGGMLGKLFQGAKRSL